MAAMLGAAVTFGSKAMHGKVNLRFTFLFSLPNINEFPFLSMSKHVLRQNIGEGRRFFLGGGGACSWPFSCHSHMWNTRTTWPLLA